MNATATIRTVMEAYIRDTDITVKRLADLSGVNRGTFSAILNRNPPKPLSVSQLDKITQAMGLSEGALYSLFVDECFVLVAPNWRRLRPFLIRCAELEKLDVIRDILTCLAERLSHNPAVFDAAEEMFLRGHYPSAILLYEYIIESEQSSHSERLAISHLRLFQIFEKDGQKSTETAMRFLNYRKRLPEPLALDGLLMLAEMYALKNHWSESIQYVEELQELTEALYRYNYGDFSNEAYKPKYPLVHYYGQAYLFRAAVHEKLGEYDQAKEWINEYADLSWFQGLDEFGKIEVELFGVYAKANLLALEVKMGNQSQIPEYVEYLKCHPTEILDGLITLLSSANTFNYNIDVYIAEFSEQLIEFHNINPASWVNRYKEHFNTQRYMELCYLYSAYCYLRLNFTQGLKYNLSRLYIAIKTKDQESIASSMLMFENYRNHATQEQLLEYNHICKEGWKNEKSSNHFHSDASCY